VASSERLLLVDHEKPVSRSMFCASTPEPAVATMRSPAASMFSRSETFSTAFIAVGTHVPAEQLMFCVAAEEMTTSASATEGAIIPTRKTKPPPKKLENPVISVLPQGSQ
jgi:hypothetical protein